MTRYLPLAWPKTKCMQLVTFLAPYAQKIAEYPGAWLIPIILLTIVSFPPLFGHELIAMFIPNSR